MDAQTKHLIIRDPVAEDWHGAHTFLSDIEVMRWIHLGPEPYIEAQSRQWIEDLIFFNQQQPRQSHNYVIIERESEQVIGWIGIGKPSQHYKNVGDFDFGYALARSRWGKGYITEAVRALFEFAFTDLQANKLFAVCEVNNIGSFRVMEKVGMERVKRFFDPESTKEMFLYTISRNQWSGEL